MNEVATITVPTELEKAANESGLVADGVASLKSAFAPHFVKFHEVAERAAQVKPDSPKTARLVRLELKSIRIAAEKTRVELKADSLRRGKAIDGINSLLEYQLVPLEEGLEKIEKAAELAEKQRKEELQAARTEELRPFPHAAIYFQTDLTMPEETWQMFMAGVKETHRRIAEQKAAEEAAIIAAQAAACKAREEYEAKQAEERARIKAENLRLAEEAAKAQAERDAANKIIAQERAEAAAREKAIADEAARLRREAESKAAQERAEAARLAEIARKQVEAAQAIIRENERKAQAAKDAEIAAAKKAAAAPDCEKVNAYINAIRALALPTLETEAGMELQSKIIDQRANLCKWLATEADKL